MLILFQGQPGNAFHNLALVYGVVRLVMLGFLTFIFLLVRHNFRLAILFMTCFRGSQYLTYTCTISPFWNARLGIGKGLQCSAYK